jgi:hypothetical protein
MREDLSEFERQFDAIRFISRFQKIGEARLIEQQFRQFRHRLSLSVTENCSASFGERK